MSYYISQGGELYHYGVKGMKWGRRKAREPVSTGMRRFGRQSSSTSTSANDQAAQQQKAERRKKALKVGAAVVGTALAAYGTYKLAQHMQNKRNQAAMQKAQDYINKNVFTNYGKTSFKDGSVMFDYANKAGDQITMRGARDQVGKAIGQHNAKTVATGRQMYKDATNTRLDRGLAKVVNAGDSVKGATKRAATKAGNAVKGAATKAKNRVLDVVNPIYENVAGDTTTKTRNFGNIKLTETSTNYYRRKVRR